MRWKPKKPHESIQVSMKVMELHRRIRHQVDMEQQDVLPRNHSRKREVNKKTDQVWLFMQVENINLFLNV